METTLAYYADLLSKDFSAYCSRELQKLGLTVGLLYYVLYVGKNPGCSPGQLCQALCMDAGHSTRSIDRLVKSGFAVREKNAKDKRGTVLKLTERGEQAYLFSLSLYELWDKEMLSDLTGEERKILSRLLEKVTHRRFQAAAKQDLQRISGDFRRMEAGI